MGIVLIQMRFYFWHKISSHGFGLLSEIHIHPYPHGY